MSWLTINVTSPLHVSAAVKGTKVVSRQRASEQLTQTLLGGGPQENECIFLNTTGLLISVRTSKNVYRLLDYAAVEDRCLLNENGLWYEVPGQT